MWWLIPAGTVMYAVGLVCADERVGLWRWPIIFVGWLLFYGFLGLAGRGV